MRRSQGNSAKAQLGAGTIPRLTAMGGTTFEELF